MNGIEVWPLWGHQGLFRIPIDTAERGLCVAVSEDANLVVSGHLDGTVRRWDVHTGEGVGNLYAIIRKARIAWLLVALYPCFAITGEAIGNVLQGQEIRVSSVAVSAESKLIVFGWWDKTVRRWDADTEEAVGSQLQGRPYGVKSLATSSDCELIVSGYSDETIRR